MAMHPALIAGQSMSPKTWRDVRKTAANPTSEAAADSVPSVREPALDITVELRSFGQFAHRLATLSGTCSIAMLWATNWLSTASKTTSLPAVPLGVATAILGVVLALLALGLEILTRYRVEAAPRLTTLEEHRKRIEAESAAFRESLPAPPPEREQRRGRLRRRR